MSKIGETGIGTQVVGAALGLNSTDYGTLCTSDLINRFAKYKPVVFPGGKGLTEANRKAARYGFTIPAHSLFNSSEVWVYNKPTGEVNSPYRIGDFRGYDHAAVSPLEFQFPASVYMNRQNEVAFLFDESMWDKGQAWRESTSLRLYDLFDNATYGELYPCFVTINRTRNNAMYFVTTERTLSDLNSTDDRELFFYPPMTGVRKDDRIELWAGLSKVKDVTGNNSPAANSIISLQCLADFSRANYVAEYYDVLAVIGYINAGFNYVVDKSRYTLTLLNPVTFTAKNMSAVRTGDVTFTASYTILDYNGEVLNSDTWSATTVSFEPNEEKTLTLNNINAPFYFDYYTQPLQAEIVVMFDIMITDGITTGIFWNDV